MNRATVVLLAALEAVIVAAIGLGICLVSFTVLWVVQFQFAGDFAAVWHATADIWLVGHGVSLTVSLDPQTVASLGLPDAAAPFQITIALLGFAALTAGFGVRTGLRAAELPVRWIGVSAAWGTFLVISVLVTLTADSGPVRPSLWEGVVLPPLVYALGIGGGFAFAAIRSVAERSTARPAQGYEEASGKQGSSRGDDHEISADAPPLSPVPGWASVVTVIRLRAAEIPEVVRVGVVGALRAGSAVAAIVIGLSAFILALLIFVNYGAIIGLYEQLQAGVVGGIALTVVQLAFLPNLVMWLMSWLVGPGFSIGTGSTVSSIETVLGPLPSVPLFGVIPAHGYTFGLLGVVVPLLAGFIVAAVFRVTKKVGADTLSALLFTAMGIGVVVGIELGLFAWWSSGALGPGRLRDVGPNPWLVAVCAAAEVAVAAAIGLVVGGRARR